MSVLELLLAKWRLWINREHSFQSDELKELQSHLLEEINFLVNREGISEEEAFHKAVDLVGEREGLDKEYEKVKSVPRKVIHWANLHPSSVIALTLIIVFALGYFLGWYPSKQEISKLNNQLYSVNSAKKAYKPFALIDNSILPINKPYNAWEIKFKTVEMNENTVLAGKGLKQAPVFDNEGNVYFIDYDGGLFSLSSTGKIRWKKEAETKHHYRGGIDVVKDGIIVGSQNGLEYLNKDGEFIWVKEASNLKGPFLSNEGLVLLVREEYASKRDESHEKQILIEAIDANGFTVWIHTIPTPVNTIVEFKTCFFDNTYSHFLFQFVDVRSLDPAKKGIEDVFKLFSVKSKNGNLSPEKVVANGKNLNHWILPSGKIANNSFILTFWQNKPAYFTSENFTHSMSQAKEIVAYHSYGKEKWKLTEKQVGYFDEQYYPTQGDSYFYTIFRTDAPDTDKGTSHIKIFSNGSLYTQVELKGKAITPLKLDKDGNIYIGVSDGLKNSIYSYTLTGDLRWSLVVYGVKDFALSPNKTILYYHRNRNELYCIQDQSDWSVKDE